MYNFLESMNKTEFIAAVADKAGLSKVDAKKAVEAFAETVSSELQNGGKVALLGFGAFSVSEKAARNGVNPKTKEPISIPARKAVKFKAGSELSGLIK
jgi:DNA-binding protein HU-beta